MTTGIRRYPPAIPELSQIGLGLAHLVATDSPAAPIRYPDIFLDDGIGTRYRFLSYNISAKVRGSGVVYAFATTNRHGTYINYIGKADSLTERLSCHERMDEAISRGANRLLVHEPKALDWVDYKTAERRLITNYCPAMNKQHNGLWGHSQEPVSFGGLFALQR